MSEQLYTSVKKIIAGAVLIAVVFSYIPTDVFVPQAQAAGGFDIGATASIPIENLTADAQKLAHTGYSVFGLPIPFTSFDSIIKLAVKKIIELLQRQTLKWITGGNNGSPLFVTDLSKFVGDTGQKAGLDFLKQLGGSKSVCDALKPNVLKGLGLSANISVNGILSSLSGGKGGIGINGINLDTITSLGSNALKSVDQIGNTIKNLGSPEVKTGFNTDNTADSNLAASLIPTSNARTGSISTYNQGTGYVPTDTTGTGNLASGYATAGCGSVPSSQYNQFAQGNFQKGGGWSTWITLSQNDGNNPMGAFLSQHNDLIANTSLKVQLAREQLDNGHGFLSQVDVNGKVVTPGVTISAQLNGVLGSDLRQLENVKNFDDIVTILAQSITTKLINGAKGLLTDALTEDPAKSKSGSSSTYLKPSYTGAAGNSSSSKKTTGSVSAGSNSNLQNVSIGGTATQSSVAASASDDPTTHDARLALTGSKNRVPKFGGVSITRQQDNPWWQVDLGDQTSIDHIEITPRVDDGYGFDLTNFYVIISTNPIVGSAIPTADGSTWVSPLIVPGSPRSDVTTITPPANTLGRYVRIQENHNARLEIAGVQVFALNTPIVTLIGDNPFTMSKGDTFEDPGAVATDQTDGDISDKIISSSNINSAVAGSYSVSYAITNTAGVSSGPVKRIVIVK